MHATSYTIASAVCAGLLAAAAAGAATITTLAESGDADSAGTKLARFDCGRERLREVHRRHHPRA